jgi:tetratricopeptide (TPR) repeat protein
MNLLSIIAFCFFIAIQFYNIGRAEGQKGGTDRYELKPELAKIIKETSDLFQQNKYADAESILKPALESHPDVPVLCYMYAQALKKLGKDSLSQVYLERFVNFSPHTAGEFRFRSTILWLMDRKQESISNYKEGCELFPDDVDLRLDFANALGSLHQNKNGLEQIETVIKSNPDNPTAWRLGGTTLIGMGKIIEAQQYYTRAVELDPLQESAWRSLLYCNLRAGDFNAWLKTFERMKRAIPDKASELSDLATRVALELKCKKQDKKNTDNYLNRVTKQGIWHWHKRAISVYIEPGKGQKGWDKHFDEILKESFAKWAKALNNEIYFDFIDQPGGDISCKWTDDVSKLPIGSGGYTVIEYFPEGTLKGFLRRSRTTFLSVNSITKDGKLEDDYIKACTIHEVGHALGLNGHSSDLNDVMFMLPSQPELSARDIKTINMLYQNKPSVKR